MFTNKYTSHHTEREHERKEDITYISFSIHCQLSLHGNRVISAAANSVYKPSSADPEGSVDVRNMNGFDIGLTQEVKAVGDSVEILIDHSFYSGLDD